MKNGRERDHTSVTILNNRIKNGSKFLLFANTRKSRLIKKLIHRHRDFQNVLICKDGQTNDAKKTIKGQHLEMRIYFN